MHRPASAGAAPTTIRRWPTPTPPACVATLPTPCSATAGSAGTSTGAPFLDNFRPELLRGGLYHADGQQLDEVYVYGSMLQSPMYQQGVRCTDCHDAHSLKLRAEGNAVCLPCHDPAGNPRFPTLKQQAYDTPAHRHHPIGNPGAECRSCHMLEKH